MTTKICSKCNKEYPATTEYFYRNRNYPDNLSKSCIQCDLERMRITRYNKNKEKYKQQAETKTKLKSKGTKICSKCGTELPATTEYFYCNSKSEDGLRCECKVCQQNQYAKYYKEKHKEEQKQREQKENDLKFRGKRICLKCNKEFDATLDFFYKKNNKDGLSTWCKECSKAEVRKYNRNNREIRKIKYKLWYAENKDNLEYKTKRKEWDNNRNQKQKFGRSFSAAICHALKGNKAGQHWEDLVPYTLEQLRKHLESQFTPEMSWDNYGEYWEVDHIIPQNMFNYTTHQDKDFQICWSLVNLRPLEKSLNRQRPKDGSDIPIEIKNSIIRGRNANDCMRSY